MHPCTSSRKTSASRGVVFMSFRSLNFCLTLRLGGGDMNQAQTYERQKGETKLQNGPDEEQQAQGESAKEFFRGFGVKPELNCGLPDATTGVSLLVFV
jgi:hypothetical protein